MEHRTNMYMKGEEKQMLIPSYLMILYIMVCACYGLCFKLLSLSGFVSTAGRGVSVPILATVSMWRSDDNLWEAVLYLYLVGPSNQPRWGPSISFIQFLKK